MNYNSFHPYITRFSYAMLSIILITLVKADEFKNNDKIKDFIEQSKNAKSPQERIQLYLSMLSAIPNDANLHFILALNYYEIKDYVNAEKHIDIALLSKKEALILKLATSIYMQNHHNEKIAALIPKIEELKTVEPLLLRTMLSEADMQKNSILFLSAINKLDANNINDENVISGIRAVAASLRANDKDKNIKEKK